MKFKIKSFVITILLLGSFVLLPAASCKQARLEQGGAYAPNTANSNGVVAAPDLLFYQADAGYDLAYSTLDAAFKFEYDNRTVLFSLSPSIKHSLDAIRPQATAVNIEWARARQAYMANPTPAGLAQLQDILSRIRQIATAAQTALPAVK